MRGQAEQARQGVGPNDAGFRGTARRELLSPPGKRSRGVTGGVTCNYPYGVAVAAGLVRSGSAPDQADDACPEPGQDPRHVGTLEPVWNLFDLTPEGRGTDWDEQLSYA